MALSYELEMATDIEPKELLSIIAKKCGLHWEKETLKAPGILVKADKQDEFEQSVTKEKFGFKPTLSVGFRINPNQDYELGMRCMVEATMTLLQQVKGDVVLLFNYETMVLQRVDNQLVFNESECQLWIAPEMIESVLGLSKTAIASSSTSR